jgi:PKD repeat protein
MGYVNQPINFSATASGIGTTLINSLTYEWNFGDGNMSTHVTPEHTFRHPGKYVVTAYASFKRQEQIARHEITILPVMLSLGTNRQGDVVVYNEAQYELDLSHYYLKGEKVFSFPPRTYVLPNQSIVISQDKVGQTDNQVVAMYDPKGTSLDMLMPPNLAPPTRMLATTDTPPAPAVAGATYSPPLPSRDPGLHTISPDSSRSDQPAPSRVATAELTPPTQPEAPVRSVTDTATPVRHQWPYLALIGLIILGIAGAFLTQRPASNQSD